MQCSRRHHPSFFGAGCQQEEKSWSCNLQDLFYSLISRAWKWDETHSFNNCLGWRLREEQSPVQKCRQLDAPWTPSAFMPEQGSLAQVKWTQHQWKNPSSSSVLLQIWSMVSLGLTAVSREEGRRCAKPSGLGQHTAWVNRRTSSPLHLNLLERCSRNCSFSPAMWPRDKAGKEFQLFQGLWCCTLMGSWVSGLNSQVPGDVRLWQKHHFHSQIKADSRSLGKLEEQLGNAT